jgi:hypothetical protein
LDGPKRAHGVANMYVYVREREREKYEVRYGGRRERGEVR